MTPAERAKKWREEHPDRYAATMRRYREKNRSVINARSRKWRLDNPDAYKKAQDNWKSSIAGQTYQKRHLQNPRVKIVRNLRNRIWYALKGKIKSSRTLALLGMDLGEFKIYIQGQFRPGMTWENYGPVWHIDHIRPCASFDLSDSEQQKICFRWDNLQPLFAVENLTKPKLCRPQV